MECVIIIAGPTASGKTGLAVELAKDIDGEVISADSMQIYKHMDIGTAKPSAEEMGGIKHYLIDEIFPNEPFSVASYKELALKYISEVLKKGKTPVVAGGTGLYINSLAYNLNFSETVTDWELRERLSREAETKGNIFLHERLKKIDPEAAKEIHPNNVKRVIRAIEVYQHTKKTISQHKDMSRSIPPEYRFIIIGLMLDRQELYERIDKRVDIMIEKGIVEEVKGLINMGYDKSTIAMQAIGYKEILSHIKGEISFEEAVYAIKKGTRNYAKRQMTWFKRLENVHWVEVGRHKSICEIVKNIKYHIASYGIFL
ncbi:tRNA dimethylallyltransferase [Anaerobacterium chartisolvens]|uniref:tRNA dimethylallyltransferase n=1 Tax=Anaerobacterium chartisolvens TaxID=1297424 RepID=A0A369ALW1_9FIRM|nr:tRNA (adenosine(37)-N6)-dimethylallyltransferase MiaA [Anaerobacterium chartisolvens]RCX10360.1 tRNA dimethylallyltransferase [Anaerobacterium chartisolvens]